MYDKTICVRLQELSLMGKMSLYNFIEACMIKWVGGMKYHTEDSKWIE